MASKSRNELYISFKTGAKPTQQNFQDLIDSALNINDDGILSDGGKIGIGIKNPTEKLEIGGNLKVSGANTTSSALSVVQNGTGNAAYFKGGSGVDITGVNGKPNALYIYDINTENPALAVEQKGTGNVAYFEGGANTTSSALWVGQNGTGNAAYFKGGGGVDITGVNGKNNALYIYDINTENPALAVEQKGTGNAAYFKGGRVDITGVNSKNNALYIYDINTENPALWVGQNGTGNVAYFEGGANTTSAALSVVQKGTGNAAYFKGGGGVKIEANLEVTGNSTLSGKVGINTQPADEQLRVQGSAAIIGNLWLGKADKGGSRLLLTSNQHTHFIRANEWWTEFVSHPNEGWKFVSTTDGQNFTEQVRITATGDTTVNGGLTVKGANVLLTTSTEWYREYDYKQGDKGPSFHPNQKVCIKVEGSIGCNGLYIGSDMRIKHEKSCSDSQSDLRTLLKIQITDFSYKDRVTNGNAMYKKVIGQQVEQVFPQAVRMQTDVVPDIYKLASVDDGWIIMATDLQPGERVKLITEGDGEAVYEVLEVTPEKFRTDVKPDGENVFICGREVDDFRVVDYDAISMLNVSATQELYKQLNALQMEVQQLKTQLHQGNQENFSDPRRNDQSASVIFSIQQ